MKTAFMSMGNYTRAGAGIPQSYIFSLDLTVRIPSALNGTIGACAAAALVLTSSCRNGI